MRLSNKKLSDLSAQLRSAQHEVDELKVKLSAMTAAVEAAEAAKVAAETAKAAAETSLEKALKQATSAADPKAVHAPPSSEICRYFVQGTCRNGAQCKYRHEMPPTSIAPAPHESTLEPEIQAVITATQETAEVEQLHAEPDLVAVHEVVPDHKRKAAELEEPVTAADIEDHKPEQPSEETRLAEMRSKLLESKRLKVQQRVVEEEEVPAEEPAESADAAPAQEPTVTPALEEPQNHAIENAEDAPSHQTQPGAPIELPTFGSGRGKLSAPSVVGAGVGLMAPQLMAQGVSLFKPSKSETTETVTSPSDKTKGDAPEEAHASANQAITTSAVLSAVSLNANSQSLC